MNGMAVDNISMTMLAPKEMGDIPLQVLRGDNWRHLQINFLTWILHISNCVTVMPSLGVMSGRLEQNTTST